MEMKSHWERVYQNCAIENLGWYEAYPAPGLKLINRCNLPKDASILHVGAGATTLVDELLQAGYRNIIANDISSSALDELQIRLGPAQSKRVQWVVDDLTNPTELSTLEQIDLWHDRAVLHFFMDAAAQDAYFNLLRKLVRKDGYAIIASFNLDGAEKCSGLPVSRYNAAMLQDKLGMEFQLLEAFDHTYVMPSGDTREYVYTLFNRKSE
jgi:SAM-dependent methyltransferase